MNRIKNVCLFIFSAFSRSPEKTLPLDLTGMARMEQHKRLDWNEALTALAQRGLGNVEWQPLLFLEVYLCMNSQAAQSEAMSGLFGLFTRKGPCWFCLQA